MKMKIDESEARKNPEYHQILNQFKARWPNATSHITWEYLYGESRGKVVVALCARNNTNKCYSIPIKNIPAMVAQDMLYLVSNDGDIADNPEH